MKIELCSLLVKAGLTSCNVSPRPAAVPLFKTNTKLFLDPQFVFLNLKRIVGVLQTAGLSRVLLIDGDHTRMRLTRELVLKSKRFYKIDTWDWWFLPFANSRTKHFASVNYLAPARPDVVVVLSSSTSNYVAKEARRAGVLSIGLISGDGVDAGLFDYAIYFNSKSDELLILDILDFIECSVE